MESDKSDANANANAIAAGWNPADGDAPFEHGEPVPPLAVSSKLEDLIPEQERDQ